MSITCGFQSTCARKLNWPRLWSQSIGEQKTDLHKFTPQVSACSCSMTSLLDPTRMFQWCHSSPCLLRGGEAPAEAAQRGSGNFLLEESQNLTRHWATWPTLNPALLQRGEETNGSTGPFQPKLYLRWGKLSVLRYSQLVSSKDLHLTYFSHLRHISGHDNVDTNTHSAMDEVTACLD